MADTSQADWAKTGVRVLDAERLPGGLVRERLLGRGWDPDEPVPATAWHRADGRRKPLLLFIHGILGDKDSNADWHRHCAAQGLFVLSLDAFLHGARRVEGIFRPGVQKLAEEYRIWTHQTAIAHTCRDVSALLTALDGHAGLDLARVGVAGVSMGGTAAMVLAWREPRITAAVNLIGAVDSWWDVTKFPPGPQQDELKAQYGPRLRQLVESLDPWPRLERIPPKALLLAHGENDTLVDIRSIRRCAEAIRPRYEACPGKFLFHEEPGARHEVTPNMWDLALRWLQTHLGA